MTKLYNALATGSALESIAMAAVIILPPLLLQKPARSSKNKDHIRCIEKRFPLWRNGQIDELLAEGRILQNRLQIGLVSLCPETFCKQIKMFLGAK